MELRAELNFLFESSEGNFVYWFERRNKGVFVAAIARALVAGEIDLAVHSAKDIPLEEDLELVIGAYPERADPRDALVGREPGATLESLPPGTVVGTDTAPDRAASSRITRRSR